MAVINGTAGPDTLNGTGTDDAIHGFAGDDTIFAGGGIDQIYGDEGSDQIFGEDGDDVIVDDLGNDSMDGGLGNDTFFLGRTTAGGQNIYNGGAGIDTLNLVTAIAGVTVDLSNTGFQAVMAGETAQFASIEKIIGSKFADNLTGGTSADTIEGGEGADVVNGGDGNDVIANGWDGVIDVSDGGAGDDTLTGDGFDTLIGGLGNDTLTTSTEVTGPQVATILGGDGDDNITATRTNTTIDAGSGNDLITVLDVMSSISLGSPSGYQNYYTYFPRAYTTATLGAGADILKFSMPLYMVVTDFDVATDILQSTGAPGGQNNPVLAIYQVYQQGADTVLIYNGTGGSNTTITSTVRLSNVDAAALAARGFTGISQGPIFTLGTEGADTYTGTPNADHYDGAGGNDDIGGAGGDDVLRGGAGDDILRPGQGADTIDGGDGYDTVSYAGLATALNIDLRLTTGQVSDGTNADTLTNFEQVVGSDAADTLRASEIKTYFMDGGAGDDVITGGVSGSMAGGAGADILNGGAGNDVFVYGAGDSTAAAADTINNFVTASDLIDLRALPNKGVVSLVSYGTSALIFANDTSGAAILQIGVNGNIQASDISVGDGSFGFDIVGAAATNVLNGGSGGDRMYGAAGADTLSGLLGADRIEGQGGNDALDGGAGDDQLLGGDGDDLLLGGNGGDRLAGGAGVDTFRYTLASDSTAAAQDVLTDFVSGTDKIQLDLSVTELSLVRSGSATFIFASTPNGAMQIGIESDVNISDLVLQSPRGIYLIGDGDSETLTGGALNDVIQAGAGDDVVAGAGGGDALWGGAGADTFKYALASDSNAAGADTLFDFQTGSDRIDLSALAPSEVSLIRSGGSTFLFATTPTGAVQLAATGDINAGDLVLGVGSAPLGVYMIGDDAINTLTGAGGGDVVQAGGGADIVTGRGGGDALWGGAGADVFKYLAASDSASSAADSIFDFQSGVDKLDLTAVKTGASDLVGFTSSGGSTFVFVDLHGDGVGDMTIQLNGTASIVAGDILF